MTPAEVGETIAPADTDAVAAALRDARGPVAVRGAGTKSTWGGELSHVDLVLETTRLSGVVAHEPGDRVVTVRAGTRLADLQALLGLARQRLAVESPLPDATIGGVLASGEAGPLRLRYGTGRDLLIGVRFVLGDGVVARSGGRVVKNVAGYDLGRLLCGSFGTVGVITEATFRLHPLPAASAWVSFPWGNGPSSPSGVQGAANASLPVALPEVVAAVRAPSIDPSAIELTLSGDDAEIAVLIEGSAAGVAARAEVLRRALGVPDAVVTDTPPPWWGRYPFGAREIGLRLAVAVSSVPAAIAVLLDRLGGRVTIRGSVGTGVLHAGVPVAVPADDLGAALRGVRALLPASGGGCVVLTAPASAKEGLDLWGPVPGIGLMRRIKAQFDPAGRFAPGRFVGGI